MKNVVCTRWIFLSVAVQYSCIYCTYHFLKYCTYNYIALTRQIVPMLTIFLTANSYDNTIKSQVKLLLASGLYLLPNLPKIDVICVFQNYGFPIASHHMLMLGSN